jgi:hypothetical protein
MPLVSTSLRARGEAKIFLQALAGHVEAVERLELAGRVDVMVVVGGKNSANTRRLAQLCAAAGVRTYHIETAAELDDEWFREARSVGVTAGASTPDWVIREVVEALGKENYREREGRWTESIAVGNEGFVRDGKERLGPKAMWREMAGANGSYELREPAAAYDLVFDAQNGDLRQKNAFFWDIFT